MITNGIANKAKVRDSMILMSLLQKIAALQAIVANNWQALTAVLVKTNLTNEEMLDAATVIDVANKADFDGYADVAGLNFAAAGISVDGKVFSVSPLISFLMTGATTPNTIYGYALMDVGLTTVIRAEKFSAPRDMVQNGDALEFVVRMQYVPPTSVAASV